LELDFETVKNIDVWTTETCFSFREAMKSWNMCVQYWLAMYVYKRFPNKKLRTLATLAVSVRTI
jgi:lysophospholipid acyltransferase 7